MAKTLLNFRRGKINTLNPLSLSGSALQKTKYHHLPEAQANKLLLAVIYFLGYVEVLATLPVCLLAPS